MRFVLLKTLSGILALGISSGVLANDALAPYTVVFSCDPTETVGNPPLEPFNAKSKMQMVYLGNEMFCYRVKFKCDKDLEGSVNVNVFAEDMILPPFWEADGGFAVGGHINSGDGFCDMGSSHLRNNEFSHECFFDSGGMSLRVEAVEGKMCSDLPPPFVPLNCYIAHDFPGCECAECQAAVCATDPFCCDTRWDGICVDEANAMCQGMCQ